MPCLALPHYNTAHHHPLVLDLMAKPFAHCLQADIKAKEDADHESQIDPKKAAIILAAGLAVRYYLLDIVKIMVILAILLGDASFVAALYVRCGSCDTHSHICMPTAIFMFVVCSEESSVFRRF